MVRVGVALQHRLPWVRRLLEGRHGSSAASPATSGGGDVPRLVPSPSVGFSSGGSVRFSAAVDRPPGFAVHCRTLVLRTAGLSIPVHSGDCPRENGVVA
jgi:hypothetical protein